MGGWLSSLTILSGREFRAVRLHPRLGTRWHPRPAPVGFASVALAWTSAPLAWASGRVLPRRETGPALSGRSRPGSVIRTFPASPYWRTATAPGTVHGGWCIQRQRPRGGQVGGHVQPCGDDPHSENQQPGPETDEQVAPMAPIARTDGAGNVRNEDAQPLWQPRPQIRDIVACGIERAADHQEASYADHEEMRLRLAARQRPRAHAVPPDIPRHRLTMAGSAFVAAAGQGVRPGTVLCCRPGG